MSELIEKVTKNYPVMAMLEMNISDIDAELKALQARKKKAASELEQIKDTIRQGMADNGITRLECGDYTFRLDPPVKVLEVTDESLIDDKFFKVRKTLDKTAVKKSIEVDGPMEGARIGEGKHRLVISEGKNDI